MQISEFNVWFMYRSGRGPDMVYDELTILVIFALQAIVLMWQIRLKKDLLMADFEEILAGAVGAGIDKDIRNCLTRSILEPKTFGEIICTNAVQEKIFHCVKHYTEKHSVDIQKISQLDILKYESNDHKAGYNFHKDFGLKVSERHLSISICLNNDYEGGEFVFDIPSGHYTVPQNVGDAVVFPSNFMFPHQVNKITKGTRYALIGWVI